MINVLSIEDKDEHRAILRRLFAKHRNSITLTTLASLADARNENPDVVLLDLTLAGDRLSGPATVRAARSMWPFAPIFVLTGDTINGMRQALIDAGARDAFEKVAVMNPDGFGLLLDEIAAAFRVEGRDPQAVTMRRAAMKSDAGGLQRAVWVMAIIASAATALMALDKFAVLPQTRAQAEAAFASKADVEKLGRKVDRIAVALGIVAASED